MSEGSPVPVMSPQPWWVLPGLTFTSQIVFVCALGAAFFSGDNTLRTMAVTAAITMAMAPQNFWFGSSKSGQDKDAVSAASSATRDATIAAQSAALAVSAPVAAIPPNPIPAAAVAARDVILGASATYGSTTKPA
jgi:hypothetical protein